MWGPQMSDLLLQTAKILPQPKRLTAPGSGAALAVTFSPATPDLRPLGSLAMVFESNSAQAEELIDSLVAAVHDSYYDQPNQSIGERFHTAMQALNQTLSAAKLSPGSLHGLCLAIAEDDLVLSDCGKAQGYLIRNRRSVALAADEADDAVAFSSITSGKVQTGDQLVLASPSLAQQVSETELKSIVTNTTPVAAVQKIAELVSDGTMLHRMAGVVGCVTTPDLLANLPLESGADSVMVGRPESALEAAAAAAAPMLKKGGDTLAKSGRETKELVKSTVAPAAAAAAQSAAQRSQAALKTKGGKRFAAVAGIIALALIAGYLWQFTASRGVVADTKSYQEAYGQYHDGVQLLGNGSKDEAKIKLGKAVKILARLDKARDAAAVNTRLRRLSSATDDPRNIAKLLDAAQTSLDDASGITKVRAVKITDLKSAAKRLAASGKALAVLMADKSTVTLVQNGSTATASLPKEAGHALDIAISDDGSTAYVLTDSPAVWEINTASRAAHVLDLSNGSWPRGTAIATYNGNLYILSDTGVSKLVPTLAGFSAPQTAISFDSHPELSRSSLLAIDGSIYLATGSGPERFVAGNPSGTVQGLPAAYKTSELATTDGDTLVLLDKSSSRLAQIAVADTKLTFKRQLSTGLSQISGISVAGGTCYLASGSAIYSFNLPD